MERKMCCRRSTSTASSPSSRGPGRNRLPVSDARQKGEHEVELLLNRRVVRGGTRYIVRWRGHTSVDDEWLQQEEQAHCPEKVVEYVAAAQRCSAARRA